MRTISTVKMKDVTFDPSLFRPMKSGRIVDSHFSSQGGLMKGTNYAIVGDPGIGKTTVMMDMLADLEKQGKKVLFISGEMNSIDMYGYVKRYPKFGDLPILFMGDYAEENALDVCNDILSKGWDVVLIDSMAEVQNAIVDTHKGWMSSKKAETELLNLFEKHNLGENDANINTAFLVIQQVTKGGEFAGSNRFKHMMTGMAHMEWTKEGERTFYFSKNRRGGDMSVRLFSLQNNSRVGWQGTIGAEN
jgi:predicted ATP-dependent serine protease